MSAAVAVSYVVSSTSGRSYRRTLRANGTPLGPAAPAVAVRSLGAFRLLRDGGPVPNSAWQSKKARTLLKMLIARRGRATPRELLMEALWPEQDPARLANRLSVALATVRAVLDPDKRRPAGYFVTSDKDSVRLDLDHVEVDVEAFLRRAQAGLALAQSGSIEKAAAPLGEAERLYVGDFLEEDRYEDWAVALREEARAVYVAVARALAERSLEAGDDDAAVRCYLRILDTDPWNEEANLRLVSALERAGRHGEARRCYRTYTSRMGELDLLAAPFPA